MNDRLMTDIFSEKQEVPDALKKRLHAELKRQERIIYLRNIALALLSVFVLSIFVISFAVIFFGNIAMLLAAVVFSAVTALMAASLAVAAGKHEIKNIQKGLS